MKYSVKIPFLICILFFCYSSSISVVYADDTNKELPTEKKLLETEGQKNSLQEDMPTKSDIYEALLKTKDDKINFLTNYINWLIAIAAIIVTIITAGINWSVRKLKQAEKEARVMISKLKKSEESIAEAQEKINLIMESGDYIKKVEDFERNLASLEKRAMGWDAQINSIIEKLPQDYQETNEDLISISGSSSMSGTATVIRNGNEEPTSEYNVEQILRGDVYLSEYIKVNGSLASRPVLIIQNNIGNKYSSGLTVIPLSTKANKKDSAISVSIKINGNEYTAIVNMPMVISKNSLRKFIGSISNEDMRKINKALSLHLDLNNIQLNHFRRA